MVRKSSWKAVVPDRAQQRELKLEALCEVAARSFNDKGFHGTSLAAIAADLGVTKPALYHYVANKNDLLYRLHMISLDAAQGSLTRARAEGRTGLEKARLTMFYYMLAMTESPTACLVLMEEGAMKPEQASAVAKRRREMEYGLREVVREGIEDGSITPCDPKLAVFVLVGAMNWMSRWYKPGGEWSGRETAEGMSAMLARSIAAAPDPLPPPPPAGRRRRAGSGRQ